MKRRGGDQYWLIKWELAEIITACSIIKDIRCKKDKKVVT